MLTLAIETPIYLILRWRDLKLFIICSALNMALNPTMNILLTYIIPEEHYMLSLVLLEVATIIVETIIICTICKTDVINTFSFAVLANGASLIVGLLSEAIYQTKVTIIVVTIVLSLSYLAFFLFVLLGNIYYPSGNAADDHDTGNNTEQNNG